METFIAMTPTPQAEQLLEDLADSLEIPSSRYEAAERSYQSFGRWLDRPESLFANDETTLYPQGSFRLGTVIKPTNDDDDYDLDAVCEIDLSKRDCTQAQLKERLGIEIRAYAKAHGMAAPVEARRCWTLNYADGAQFHMDVLPALPDGTRQRLLVEAMGGSRGDLAEKSIAITDTEHPTFNRASDDWPASNPKGYSEWFYERMKTIFDAKRRAMMLAEARTTVEDIPTHRVRTPLQAAIKILKRHRDMRFSEDVDNRPISIILTTLAAHAYNQETTISAALYSILTRMDHYIEDRNGVAWIANPTDPRENFADKWEIHPERKTAFTDWLQMARVDFSTVARLSEIDQIVDALAPRMGRKLMEATAAKRRQRSSFLSTIAAARNPVSHKLRRILDAPHRKPLAWQELTQGSVSLTSMTVTRRGFRPYLLSSDGQPIPKRSSLRFEAHTTVQPPYKVYWQVVNTGEDARKAKGLRGGFEEGTVQPGQLQHEENAVYVGSHSIECFIVKSGYCVARSGSFIVNIA